jgi:hypothetical protein
MVGEDEDRRVVGRVVAPPAVPGRVLPPRAGAAAEHVAAHHGRADIGLGLLHHRRAGVDLAALKAVQAAPRLEPDDPLVELHAADTERMLLALVRAGGEPVQ